MLDDLLGQIWVVFFKETPSWIIVCSNDLCKWLVVWYGLPLWFSCRSPGPEAYTRHVLGRSYLFRTEHQGPKNEKHGHQPWMHEYQSDMQFWPIISSYLNRPLTYWLIFVILKGLLDSLPTTKPRDQSARWGSSAFGQCRAQRDPSSDWKLFKMRTSYFVSLSVNCC